MTPEEISAKIRENGGAYAVRAVMSLSSLWVTCSICGSRKQCSHIDGDSMVGFLPVFLTCEEAQKFATDQGKGALVEWLPI